MVKSRMAAIGIIYYYSIGLRPGHGNCNYHQPTRLQLGDAPSALSTIHQYDNNTTRTHMPTT